MRDASEHDSEEDQDADHDGDDEVGDDDESDVGDQESDKEESEEDQNDKEQENAEGEGSSDDEEDSEDNQGASSPFFPDNFTELFGKPELEGANSDVEENPMDNATTLVLGDDVAALEDVEQEAGGDEDETSTEDGSDEDDGHMKNDLVTPPPKRPAVDTEVVRPVSLHFFLWCVCVCSWSYSPVPSSTQHISNYTILLLSIFLRKRKGPR